MVKYATELFILVAEIFVSTPIRAMDSNMIRQMPLPFRSFVNRTNSDPTAPSPTLSSINNNPSNVDYVSAGYSNQGYMKTSGNTETLLYQMNFGSPGESSLPPSLAPPVNPDYNAHYEDYPDEYYLETSSLLTPAIDERNSNFQVPRNNNHHSHHQKMKYQGLTPVLRGDSVGKYHNDDLKFV
jgi:hypothetical protein